MADDATLFDFDGGAGGEGDGGGADRPAGEAEAVVNGGSAPVVDASDYRYPDADGHVELAVMQVDYTIEGSGSDEYPVLHVFGRTAENEVEHVRVREFKPYFYTPTASLSGAPEEQFDRITGSETTDEDGEPYESIRGERLTKVFGQTPRDVGQLRDRFDHYEADILFPNRLLIDKDITSGIRVPAQRAADGAIEAHHEQLQAVEVDATPRVCTFDIEVDDRRGFPEDGEETVVCLTSHDSYTDEYVNWIFAGAEGVDPPETLGEFEPLGEGAGYEVRRFEDEQRMLASFVDYVEQRDFDVLTGWNFTDFDAPYLLDRLEVLGGSGELDPDRLSRVGEVWRSDWQGPNIKGRVAFDLLYAYKRTQFTELESYRLDAVGEAELGVGKERYAGDIGDLWEQDPERLLEYNTRDVELCVELNRKQEIIPFWQEVASFVGCKLEDAPTPGDAVDMYVLHKVHGEFALPSKGAVDAEEYAGGAVFEPITGVKEMVSVLDLASLYPMCMVTINASPETKVDESYDGETYHAPNGMQFRKEPDGIIREMVTELLAEREEKKALRDDHEPGTSPFETYDRQQSAVKVIMNSLYGVLGWDRFRLYDKDMGAAVTATGRRVIEYTQETVDEFGYDVIYGDSVTGDRPVVVRDPDEMIRVLPIEQLFEAATDEVDSGIAITADGGMATVADAKDRRLLDGWEALSLSSEGDAEWQPIEQVIRHETEKDVVKLQHKFGESRTTGDHSYVVEDGDGFKQATPEEVDSPLRVPGIPDLAEVTEIDIYEVLNGYTREYEDGRSVGSENAETKIKGIHGDDEWVWFGHEHHRDQSKTVRVKRHVDLTGKDGEALVRLLAAYVSKGSSSTVETTRSRFGASISEERREWLEGLRRDYQRLFDGSTASIIAADTGSNRTVEYETEDGSASVTYNDGTKKIQMMNELAAVFFREFAGQTSRGKRIPSFVFHLQEDLQDLFLDVLVEGDGSREFPRYSDEYAERNFDFETTSRRLAAGLSTLLTQRGKKHSLKYRDSKDSYTIRTCDWYRGGRDPVLKEVSHDGYVYDLSVAENDNFVDGVGGIVLHNTDSIMLEFGNETVKQEAIEQSFELEELINDSYDELAAELNAEQHRFEIEFEKLYRRFFQAGKKKRYAGHIIWSEGKDVDDIDITGFEYKRSDIAPVTKEVQEEVLRRIVTSEVPLDQLRDEITEYVHGVIQRFKDGEVSVEEVGIPGGIGKKLDNYDTDTAQVRGAKYANLLLGTNFGRGSKPKRVYLDGVHYDFFRRFEEENPELADDPLYVEFKENQDVVCIEYADQLPDEFEVNWDAMLEKTLKGPIARVLEAIDVSWEEVESGQEQTGLEQYF